MDFALAKVAFAREISDLVKDFDCRANPFQPAEPWEEEVNNWIKADEANPDGALACIKRKGKNKCDVWLYVLQGAADNPYEVVGYAALGASKWPPADHEVSTQGSIGKMPALILNVGIQTAYQGGPRGAPVSEKYSTQILDDLVIEARAKLAERQPFLGLYVHPGNHRAIAKYKSYGFEPFANTWTNDETGVVYQSMILSLRPTKMP